MASPGKNKLNYLTTLSCKASTLPNNKLTKRDINWILTNPSPLLEFRNISIFARTGFAKPYNFSKVPPFARPIITYCGGKRGSPNFFFSGVLIFLLLRNPCKIAEPYDNPFWKNEKTGQEPGRHYCNSFIYRLTRIQSFDLFCSSH